MSQQIPPPFNHQPTYITTNRPISFFLGIGIVFLPIVFSWFTLRNGYSSASRIISLGWLAFVLVAMFGNQKGVQGTQQVSSGGQQSAPPSVYYAQATPEEMYQAYDSNEIAADRMYKDHPLEVSGIVSSIDSDFSDDAVVRLETSNQFMSVMASGDNSFNNQAANLSKGQKITVHCLGGGEIAGSAMLKDCQII